MYNRGGAWMFTRQSSGEWTPTWNFGAATPLSDTANPLESRAGHTVVRPTLTYETDLGLLSSVCLGSPCVRLELCRVSQRLWCG